MTVQNNTSSMSAYRNMYTQKKEKEKEDEKLSSGYKINDAADDAAGLAISEKMRSQITVSQQAQRNVSDASNLVKTAEGAMQQVNDMLIRTKELATQSSNGTYSASDREAIQLEMDALVSEINRIAESTNFNGISLLDGSADSLTFEVGSDTDINLDLSGASTALQIDASQMSIVTQEQALEMLEVLEDFVTSITSERTEFGATSNRLAHTSQNLATSEEYLQRSESQIRDADMAKSASDSNQKSVSYQLASNMFKQAEEDKKGIMNLLG